MAQIHIGGRQVLTPATMPETQASLVRNAIVYNPGFVSASVFVNRDEPLDSFVRLLRQRYERVLPTVGSGSIAGDFKRCLWSLTLAEAALEKAAINHAQPFHPLQVAVIGPTQAGKSTVVNWLLGVESAHVSPLAGFTVHPQGFAIHCAKEQDQWLDDFFRGYRRCRVDELPIGNYQAFALEEVSATESHPLRGTVIWDTPDFDSVDAAEYRASVLRTIALADIIVLVVSKDKYADQSVWDTMRLLEALEQPTLICLNKTSDDTQGLLERSLKQKWQECRKNHPPTVCALPFRRCLGDRSDAAALAPRVAELREKALKRRQGLPLRLLRMHWRDWTAPVRAEHEALLAWNRTLDVAAAEALQAYRRDFLGHPQHYETFQRALAELLSLLEVPGIARGLEAARRFVTWPVRQLTRIGRSLSRRDEPASHETVVIRQCAEHLLIRVTEAVAERMESDQALRPWWRAVSQKIRSERPALLRRTALAIDRYHVDFQPQIERTARQLYDKLKEHPAVLNGLRATRVSTDAAALALALHTGGIGIQDFVIAPAMLSLTSMLAESALGHFLGRSEAELKQRQIREVERLFASALVDELARLPESLSTEGRFAIEAESLQAAESRLG